MNFRALTIAALYFYLVDPNPIPYVAVKYIIMHGDRDLMSSLDRLHKTAFEAVG